MIFELHGAQVEAILLLDQWLDEHYHGPDPEVLARVRDIIEQNLSGQGDESSIGLTDHVFMLTARHGVSR